MVRELKSVRQPAVPSRPVPVLRWSEAASALAQVQRTSLPVLALSRPGPVPEWLALSSVQLTALPVALAMPWDAVLLKERRLMCTR